MKRDETNTSKSVTINKRTPEEMRQWYEENKDRIYRYEQSLNLKLLRDITKGSTKLVSAFSKESLRQYLQNIGSNEKNLRNLSRYLYYRSQVYFRLINYFSNMFALDARSIIPNYDITKDNDKDKIKKSYYDTIRLLDKMGIQSSLLQSIITCFREDVFYGCVYFDEKSNVTPSMFIMPLDPDYCRIQGVYETGEFGYAMDMSYFRNRQDILEYWGEPFIGMYNDYSSSGIKYQTMPEKYSICLKYRSEDWETIVPPFSGLFNSLINLLDLEDIQAIADEQQIYKLIWLELETIVGSKESDDWKINPEIMIEYFNRMVDEAIPDYTSAAIIPGKLNQISFDNDQATDTNKIEKATETILNTSGGAQILNSATISGSTAFLYAIKSDTEFAISTLLPQIQGFVNRFLSYYISNPSKVKFFEVSIYTKTDLKKELLESAQYGLPTKLAINNLSGFSELDTLALNFLEEECLELSNKFKPLSSTHTQGNSDKESGGQIKEITELTDDGEASIDKRDNSNG